MLASEILSGEGGQIILEALPISINFFNANMEIIDCTEATVERYNLSSKEDYCRHFFRLMPPIQPNGRSSKVLIKEYVKEAFENGSSRHEFLRQKPDGSLMPTEVNFTRVEFKGTFIVAGHSRDLTEIHALAEREKEARSISEKLMESTPLGIETWDSSMNILDCNQQAADMFGYVDKNEFLHRIKSEWHGVHIPHLFFYKAMEDGFARYEWDFDRIDGSSLPCEVRLMRVRVDSYTRIMAYFHNLSDIKYAMEKTREAEKQAEKRTMLMLDSTPLACFLVREDVTALDCNLAAVELFGFSSKADAIERYREIFPTISPEGEPMRIPTSLKWLNTTTSTRLEYVHKSMDGEYIPCEVTLSYQEFQGNPIVATYIQDQRELKRMRAQMTRIELAEEESRAKSQFLARMSHEIRTPLNAIMGISDIELLKTGHAHETEEAFLQIRSSSNILLSIINDILDLSKVEAGKMEVFHKPYEIASLIFDTVQLNLMYLGSKNINFTLKIDENIPKILIGDELRIKQILNNLLSNAFKYTHEGGVRAIFAMDKAEDVDFLIMQVQDTGQGMTEEQIATLFSGEYIRFNEENNRMIEGTGLGMNITYRLVKAMNGEITAESVPGKGTTFCVRLPQRVENDEALGREIVENLENFQASQRAFQKRHNFEYEPLPYGKVLVVDDVESNLYVAKGLLLPYELTVDTAVSGFEAINLIKSGKVYDIIFMDHMMPDMDGIEAAKIIFSTGYKQPVVALTANTIMGQSELFMNNGFSGFISKPIDVSNLNNYLMRLIRDKYPEEVVRAAKRSSRPQGEPSSQLMDSFLRDANKAIKVLGGLLEKPEWDDNDFKLFTINTHGMKSALTNIDKAILSETAGRLEQAGNDKNMEIIRAKTSVFLEDLKEVVSRLSPQEEEQDEAGDADENTAILREQLKIIQEACDAYNKKAARKALEELQKYQWSKETKTLLGEISANLLHSAFEDASEKIGGFL
ncbi:MAG: ATP-binding protein [Defluviitaleaceae bacterium]|nr:ATP-binding protein [Defluviitaleaceae bacterium]